MNNDDFWTTLAAGHTNTVLSGAMDSHLSGKSLEESFGSVRDLTDKMRAANALSLPVEAGTKVVFAGGMGAYLAYDDIPADGIEGEVVTVKSATGEITHHDGKVFVKWADGKFRPIHAEHLRLAGQSKSAAREVNPHALRMTFDDFKKGYFKGESVPNSIAREFWDDFKYAHVGSLRSYIKATSDKTASVSRKKMENAIAGKMPPDSKRGRGANREIMLTGDSAKVIGKDEYSRHKMSDLSDDEITTLYNFLVLGKRAGFDPSNIGKEKGPHVHDDEDADLMGLFTQDEHHETKRKHKRKASVIRVASLGDLTQFLKRADGKLVHKSTNDLWSYSKDADGNFLVERLFDDNGEPLQG